MRNRQMQRKLEKKQRIRSCEKPWLNSEGYRDPTAYSAIKNISRREASQQSTRHAK